MEKLRAKPQQEPFLGTAEIIRRVQAAQAEPSNRWLSRGPQTKWLALAVMTVGLCGTARWLVVQDVAPRPSPWKAAAGVVEAAPELAPALELAPAPEVAPAAAARGKAHTSARGPKSAASHRHGGSPVARARQVQVHITGQVGTIWLDGSEVSHGERTWNGPLTVGSHQLAVRVGGHMVRRSFEVGNSGLAIIVDPAQQSIVVHGLQAGHRAARAP